MIKEQIRNCYLVCDKCKKETLSRTGIGSGYNHYYCTECNECTGFMIDGEPHTWKDVDLDKWKDKGFVPDKRPKPRPLSYRLMD